MYISRISSLKGFADVLVGRDLGKALIPGHVYGIKNVNGSIILEDLGIHAESYWQKKGATISQIMNESTYLFTEPEHMQVLEKEFENYISDADMDLLKEYKKRLK